MSEADEKLANIRDLVSQHRYRVTLHARIEMDADEISAVELVSAITSKSSAIIEDYPEDRRGHSHLLLCMGNNYEPIHVCCAISGNELVIITVYRPGSQYWMDDWRTRK